MIDKLTPQKFVTTKDQRFVAKNEMIVAQNVSIEDRGNGTGSVLKTMPGTSAITSEDLFSTIGSTVKVIGQVYDPQRDFVYAFVTNGTNGSEDGIYRCDGDEYVKVFKSSWLNIFGSDFVKADVINKAFDRGSGQIQTILYFTDGRNSPRKINVDRAIEGDFDGMTNDDLDIALNVIKGPSTTPPTFTFETDDDFNSNNFTRNTFQFATQNIYKDGEVSALSPYSKLAVSNSTVYSDLEDTSFGVSANSHNVCVIRHNVDSYTADLNKIRILARNGNSGAFHVVDEFDPKEDRYMSIKGSANQKVYDSVLREYTFYNTGLGRVIPDVEAQKLYDNVPLRAEGQTLTAGRLMYSNYTEGLPVSEMPDDAGVTITAIYADSLNGVSDIVGDQSEQNAMITSTTSPFEISLDIEGSSNISNATTFDAGSVVEIKFKFNPTFELRHVDGLGNGVAEIELVNQATGFAVDFEIDALSVGGSGFSSIQEFSLVTITPSEFTTTELANHIQSILDSADEVRIAKGYTAQWHSGASNVDVAGIYSFYFKFGEVTTSADSVITFKPRVVRASLEVSTQPTGWVANQEYSSILLAEELDTQSDHTYHAVSANTVTSKAVSISNTGTISSFKSGALHSFGIVYYDKWGRSSFVREIGNAYAKMPSERNGSSEKYGAVSFSIYTGSTNFTVPNYADSFQFVYGGSSVSDVFQYTVGGAYVKRLEQATSGHLRDIDTSSHHIYVSLKTLDKLKDDKLSRRDYSFTEGDKLRIVSLRNSADNGDEYPLDTNGNPIEFTVLGVETLDESPIEPNNNSSNQIAFDSQNPYKGTFLVLSAPAVESTAGNAGQVNKFTGFDWYQISGENYNTTDTVANPVNYWNREVLVEIITPSEDLSEKVYYEIGERKPVLPNANVVDGVSVVNPRHGKSAHVLTGSEVYYRPVACNTPTANGTWKDMDGAGYDGDYNTEENPETWAYKTKYVEDFNVTDNFSSRNWDKGKAHTVFNDAVELNRYNGITYSDPYVEDSAYNGLSSFTPSLANFFDLPSEHGACKFIGNLGDRLLTVQENKCHLVGVNKDVINTGSGDTIVSLSRNVLSNLLPFNQDYGSQERGSIVIHNSMFFGVDVKRRGVFAGVSNGSMKIISEIDVSSEIDRLLKAWDSNGKEAVVCGYDPDDQMLYVTLRHSNSNREETLGFSLEGQYWTGKYTFRPDLYSTFRNGLIGYKYSGTADNETVFHEFGNESNSNDFLGAGSPAASTVHVVSVADASMVKYYKSISLESDSAWSVSLESSLGQETVSLSLVEKEDAFYASALRDATSKSTSQHSLIGVISEINGNVLTMKNSLRGISIPVGADLSKYDTDYISLAGDVSSVDRPNKKITVTSTAELQANDKLFFMSNRSEDGDQIRGHYCIIKCSITPSGSNTEELFAVNANYVESKANHRMAQ